MLGAFQKTILETKFRAIVFKPTSHNNSMRIRYSFSSRRSGAARDEHSNKHRTPFPKLAKEVIRISDIVLEVLDARFIEKTRNVEMENYAKEQGKMLIYILNKSDLANKSELMKNLELEHLKPYVFYSCKSPIGRKNLRTLIKIFVKKGKFAQKHAKAHVGVIGYPNTGKSSLINTLAGGGRAPAAQQSGFTRSIKKIRFNKDILIIDTPGVFQEKENIQSNSIDLKKQAEIGVRTYDSVKSPDFVVHKLMQEHPGLFESFYEIESNGDVEVLLDILGRRKGFVRKGNLVDADKTSRYILKDWQEGKIKRK